MLDFYDAWFNFNVFLGNVHSLSPAKFFMAYAQWNILGVSWGFVSNGL